MPTFTRAFKQWLPICVLAASTACSQKQETPAASLSSASAALSAPPAPLPAPSQCALKHPKRLQKASFSGTSSPIALASAGAGHFVLAADEDEQALHVIRADSMQQIGVTPLSGTPGHVTVLPTGHIALTLRDKNQLVLLEPADDNLVKPLEERCALTLPAEPWAMANSQDTLLVASGMGAALTVYHLPDFAQQRVIALPREPRAVLIPEGEQWVFVSHAAGGVASAVDLSDLSKAPETIDLKAGRRLDKNGAPDDKRPREATQGYALASIAAPVREGQAERRSLRIFAPHTSVDPGAFERGVSIGYGGGGDGPRPVAPIVSVLDPIAKRSITNHVAGAFNSTDCMLPRSAAAGDQALFVACLGIDAVLELDPWIGDPMAGEHRRFPLPAGPTGLVLSEDSKVLWAWSAFDRAVSKIELESGQITPLALWRRAGKQRDARWERGRRLFHSTKDSRISLGRACATCHPEGRDDGLLWTSPDGPRQTPMLAGRLKDSAPYGWFGDHPTVTVHLENTFERLGGTGLQKQPGKGDLEALVVYVESLPLPPAWVPADEKAVARGKQAFASYGCNDCHKGGGGIDGRAHNLGTAGAADKRQSFDTPSLVRVRASAPYFHDGRYATLEELLSATDTKMIIGVLSDSDKKDMIAYLETL